MACMRVIIFVIMTSLITELVFGTPYCRPQVLADDGDVTIAAIVELHETLDNNCGPLSNNEFLISVALKWAVDTLNGGENSSTFIPGVKLGYEIYDDCGLESLSGKHVADILNTYQAQDCMESNNTEQVKPILGVIGTTISQTTTTVSRLLKGSGVPIVGISATLPELSNKTLYPNFIRSIPSDILQAKVMVDVIEKLNWNYVIGIHTDDNYGIDGFEEFQTLAKARGICISKLLTIRQTDPNLSTKIADFIRGLLFQISDTVGDNLGVVYFGQAVEAKTIFETVQGSISLWHNQDKIHNIHWLMSDGVGTSLSVASAHNWLQSLLLSVSASRTNIEEVKQYYLDLIKRYDDPTLSSSWRKRIVEFIRTFIKCDPLNTLNTNLTSCNCNLNNEILEKYYHPDGYLSSALDAVYILAASLKNAHTNLCSGQSGLCAPLKSALENRLIETGYKPSQISYRNIGLEYSPVKFYTKSRVLTVDMHGDYEVNGDALYDIFIAQNERFSKIGNYEGGKLNVKNLTTTWSSPLISQCSTICEECLINEDVLFDYIPGDVLIIGLFPVHNPGQGYGCGDFRSSDSSYLAMLAFRNSVMNLKAQTGISFGGLILDDCYNPLRAVNILNMFFSGNRQFIDKYTGHVIDPNAVVAVVGAQSSSIALNILPTLTSLRIPLISYSATSPELDDKMNYPFFLRTVPSDALQAKAIFDIVHLLNVTHISAINVNNIYGRKGIAAFKLLAQMHGICVEKSIELAEKESEIKLVEAISKLTISQSKYVVLFGLTSIAIDLLNNLDTPFVFIASETWGQNLQIIQGKRGQRARGSITLGVQTSLVANNDFYSFLSDLRSSNNLDIRWFNLFWTSMFKCNIPQGFNNKYTSTCSLDLQLSSTTINSFLSNQRVVQTTNAVLAVGQGYLEAIKSSCANPNSTLCRPAADLFVSQIKAVQLASPQGNTFRVFDDKGNGKIGFIISNIQRLNDGSYAYVKVMVDVIEKLNWNYVIGIHTDDNYGIDGFEEFQTLAKARGICISKLLTIRQTDPNLSTKIADFIRGLLFQISDTVGDNLGVVYFGQAVEAKTIFETVQGSISLWHNQDKIHNIHWLMSDGVGTSLSVASAHNWLQSLLLSVSASRTNIEEVKQYYLDLIKRYDDPTLSSSWRKRIVEFIRTFIKCDPLNTLNTNLTSCNLNNEILEKYYHPDGYLSSALDAVYILAASLKNAHTNLCSGQSGLCAPLKSALENRLIETGYKPSQISYRNIGLEYSPVKFYTKSRVLTVDMHGDYEVNGDALYDIFIAQNERFSKIGNYEGGKLNVKNLTTTWSSPLISQCSTICEECLINEDVLFDYIPGDVLIIGLFPVHNPGQGYGCGDFRSSDSSYLAMLAFRNSVMNLKAQTGISFGGLILDDCYNPLRAVNILNMFFSGNRQFIDKYTGHVIDPNAVVAVVGAQSSSIALNILPTLTSLRIPLISYSATSPELDDKMNYPFFLRTVPSDALQAKAIFDIVHLLNVTHISAINVNNIYGRKGIAAFKLLAQMHGICVEKSIELAKKESEIKLVEAISKLTISQSKYVVLFGLTSIAIDLLNNLDTPFVFIASETWGQNLQIIQGKRGQRARGSITLGVQTSLVANNDFYSFLSDLRSSNNLDIRWFNLFWTSMFKCNIPQGFNNKYTSTCSLDLQLSSTTINSFLSNQRVVQTTNAVLAVGQGYLEAIKSSCANPNSTLCRPAADLFVSQIKAVQLASPQGNTFRVFDDKGNGKIGFIISNIQRLNDGSYAYVKVGTYDINGLKMNLRDLKFYNAVGNIILAPESSCKYITTCKGQCVENVPRVTTPNTSVEQIPQNGGDNSGASSDGGLIAAVAVLAVLVVILLIFMGVVVFLVFREKIKATKNTKPTPSEQFDKIDNSDRPTSQDIRLYDVPTRCSSTTQTTNSNSSGIKTASSGARGSSPEEPVMFTDQLVSSPTHRVQYVPDNAETVSVMSGYSDANPNRIAYLNPIHRIPDDRDTISYLYPVHKGPSQVLSTIPPQGSWNPQSLPQSIQELSPHQLQLLLAQSQMQPKFQNSQSPEMVSGMPVSTNRTRKVSQHQLLPDAQIVSDMQAPPRPHVQRNAARKTSPNNSYLHPENVAVAGTIEYHPLPQIVPQGSQAPVHPTQDQLNPAIKDSAYLSPRHIPNSSNIPPDLPERNRRTLNTTAPPPSDVYLHAVHPLSANSLPRAVLVTQQSSQRDAQPLESPTSPQTVLANHPNSAIVFQNPKTPPISDQTLIPPRLTYNKNAYPQENGNTEQHEILSHDQSELDLHIRSNQVATDDTHRTEGDGATHTPSNDKEHFLQLVPGSASRPVYKRNLSYVTGEELNPFPSACDTTQYTDEMEV